jgi:hypothetical protein
MDWGERNEELPLFVVVLIVEFGRVAETQNLAARMTRENAIRPLGFERNDGNIPRAGAVSGSHAAARQPFERFELENRACRPDRAD